MEERIMYVIQRADGKFYWQHQQFPSVYGYDSFDKAHLFELKRRADFKIGECGDEQKCKVKRVKVVLDDKEEISTSFGNFTVWNN